MELEAIFIEKPKKFKEMDESALREFMKAKQRVLALSSLIDEGEAQLKEKTGYDNAHLPKESPDRTNFTLDDIAFNIITNVKVNNPEYQVAFDKIVWFLEELLIDGSSRYGVRTYEDELFVRWDYLMGRVFRYVSGVTNLGVENKFESIVAPDRLDTMKLSKLVMPINIVNEEFNINKAGSAEVWYLMRRFYAEVMAEIVEPVKEETARKSGVSTEQIPDETTDYLTQVGKYFSKIRNIPSHRRQPGQAINRIFMIPQKDKPKGSTEPPIVVGPDNYLSLLDEYRPLVNTSLKKWTKLEGKIGELIIPFYDIGDHEKVQKEFPAISEYNLIRDGNNIFVSIRALYNRMKALEKDYKKNRLLTQHEVGIFV